MLRHISVPKLVHVMSGISVGLCLGACDDERIAEAEPICDGIEQLSEQGVDAPFDLDGDGFFDGGDPDCSAYYEVTDCDDTDAEIHPGGIEVPCDGRDNDCDEETPDAEDADGDGVDSCLDCDDLDAEQTAAQGVDMDQDGVEACQDCDDSDSANFPGNLEVCDDQDNDCSGLADDGIACFTDYSGTWTVTPEIRYDCFFDLDIAELEIIDAGVEIFISTVDGGKPGTLSGYRDGDDFTVTKVFPGVPGYAGCTVTYTLTGSFQSFTEFTGTFRFSDTGGACFCSSYTEDIVGSR